jgi:hypothetical protein
MGELSLFDIGVTDAGLEIITRCRALRRVDLRGTKVTDKGIKALREARPELTIVYGPG